MVNTPKHGVRVPDDLWNAASARSKAQGETVTDVVIRALTAYVDDAPLAATEWDETTRELVAQAAQMWARVVEDEGEGERLSKVATQLRAMAT